MLPHVSFPSPDGPTVEIRISARPELIPTVRAVASDLAGRADFDLDAISDLRMAVDEACATLVGLTTEDRVLSCRFFVGKEHIEVVASSPAVPTEGEVSTASFGWRVLQTLADEVSSSRGLDGQPDAVVIRLVKHAGAAK
ncbi:ATP-binding protein [Pseudonocardia eucalypti]|uniref:ATP-binding protein n=1 Tax=Pseudonocardia eucalypti TaxID=648755 RepID=A0ABP9Q7U1_9PSEU